MLTEEDYRRLLGTLARHRRMLRVLGTAYLRDHNRGLPSRDIAEMKELMREGVSDLEKLAYSENSSERSIPVE